MTKIQMKKELNQQIRSHATFKKAGHLKNLHFLLYGFARTILEEHLGIDVSSIDFKQGLEQAENPLLPRTPCFKEKNFTYGRGKARGE